MLEKEREQNRLADSAAGTRPSVMGKLGAAVPGPMKRWTTHIVTDTYTRLCIHVMKSEVAQTCPTLCDPVDCSPPGSSIHGILQARILEWVAIPSSRGSSQPRDRTQVSCTASRFFIV